MALCPNLLRNDLFPGLDHPGKEQLHSIFQSSSSDFFSLAVFVGHEILRHILVLL